MKGTGMCMTINICRSIIQQVISVALAFVFLFEAGIGYLQFRHQQSEARLEIIEMMEKGLSEHDLVLIIVPESGKPGLSWLEPGREFRYNGEMYDVVKTGVRDQDHYYYCINDSKEQQLISNYKKNTAEREKAKRYRSPFTLLYFPPQFILESDKPVSDLLFATVCISFDSNCIDILTPPPRRVNIS